MDINAIALAAVPYLIKGAEAFSKRAGELFANNVGELYRTVKSKFKGDSYAEQTLTRAEEQPESKEYQATLGKILAEKMTSDEDFANSVCNLVNAIRADKNIREEYNVVIHDNNYCNIIGGGEGNTIGGR